jgi:antitoxin ParD1/3/4
MRLDLELDRNLHSFVAELVAAGRYESEADVVREGLRQMRDREEWLAGVDRGVTRGLADAEAGRTKTLDEARTLLSTTFGTAGE